MPEKFEQAWTILEELKELQEIMQQHQDTVTKLLTRDYKLNSIWKTQLEGCSESLKEIEEQKAKWKSFIANSSFLNSKTGKYKEIDQLLNSKELTQAHLQKLRGALSELQTSEEDCEKKQSFIAAYNAGFVTSKYTIPEKSKKEQNKIYEKIKGWIEEKFEEYWLHDTQTPQTFFEYTTEEARNALTLITTMTEEIEISSKYCQKLLSNIETLQNNPIVQMDIKTAMNNANNDYKFDKDTEEAKKLSKKNYEEGKQRQFEQLIKIGLPDEAKEDYPDLYAKLVEEQQNLQANQYTQEQKEQFEQLIKFVFLDVAKEDYPDLYAEWIKTQPGNDQGAGCSSANNNNMDEESRGTKNKTNDLRKIKSPKLTAWITPNPKIPANATDSRASIGSPPKVKKGSSSDDDESLLDADVQLFPPPASNVKKANADHFPLLPPVSKEEKQGDGLDMNSKSPPPSPTI